MPPAVVFAVNFIEGGPLTVLRKCLASASSVLPGDWDIVALVHSTDLISEQRVGSIAIPDAKKSWMRRFYWEWLGFNRMSPSLKPDLWLALHDITPRVVATRQVVYCHNPFPFYRIGLREALLEPNFLLFNKFYGWLYRIFIRRNDHVIVQQGWLRAEFRRRIGNLQVVVAHPSLHATELLLSAPTPHCGFVFFYPALPRVFKNIETLCEAVRILASRGVADFEVRLTLSGNENRYARWLRRRFGSLSQIRFLGRQTKEEMNRQYLDAPAVVFPSKLETWGLPITEAKVQQRPLLAADLAYTHETVGTYDLVSFFPAESPVALAGSMQSIIEGSWRPAGHRQHAPGPPFAPNWESLWGIPVDGLSSPARTSDQKTR